MFKGQGLCTCSQREECANVTKSFELIVILNITFYIRNNNEYMWKHLGLQNTKLYADNMK